MTHLEAELLRAMPMEERVRRYLPRLLNKQLTEEQYAYITGFGLPVRSEANDPESKGYGGERSRSEVNEEASSVLGRSGHEVNAEYSNYQARTGEATSAIQSSVSSVLPGCTNEPTARTNNGGKHKKPTQCERLLDYLQGGEWRNTPDIQENVYGGSHLGVARISARIYELRRKGYQIEGEKVKGSIWRFRLRQVGEVAQEEGKFEEIMRNITAG